MDGGRGTFQPTPYGHYLLLERIGSGGMAEIFRAKTFGAAGFEKEYAIKRILPNLVADDQFVEMFINEAKLVVDLYHANIVQVFDLGDIDGTYFIAMEFVHGKDLLDLLARCTENDLKIPLKLTLHIAMEMLKGLDFAHKASDKFGEPLGIIHRDVSPSNVMLSYGGDTKVGDFGVAKARTQTHLTEVGTLKGKVGYMSPEQVRGEVIDHRSDIFAAGIILYECLTMTRLFMGGNDLDVMLKIRDSDIEDELSRFRKVPPTLLDILRKALTKDREDRFQTCMELYGALRDFSYEHGIKTSNQDLSSFMQRVFEEEMTAEKSRRLEEDPSLLPEIQQQPNLGAPKAMLRGSMSTVDAPVVGDGEGEGVADAMASTDLAQAPKERKGNTGYYYRGFDQSVHGPLSLDKLKILLTKMPERDGEAVSIGKLGDWRSVDDLPELWSVDRPRQGFDLDLGGATSPDASSSGLNDEGDTQVGSAALAFTGDFTGAVTNPSESAISLAGHLGGQITYTRLLARLNRKRSTGMLRVEHGGATKDIYLRRGDPVSVSSNVAEELLGTYLLRRKVLTQDQLNRALQRLSEFGGRLGDALVGERVLAAHDLFRYLSEQIQDRILDVFQWPAAQWTWYPDAAPTVPGSPLGVDFVELILDGVRKKVPAETIRGHFGAREGAKLTESGSRIGIRDLPLAPDEKELAESIRPGATPQEVVTQVNDLGGPREALAWRVLYVMTEFEICRLGDGDEDVELPS